MTENDLGGERGGETGNDLGGERADETANDIGGQSISGTRNSGAGGQSGVHPFMDFMEDNTGLLSVNGSADDPSQNEIEENVYPHCGNGSAAMDGPQKERDDHQQRDEQTLQRIRYQNYILQLKAHKYAVFGPAEDVELAQPVNSFVVLNLTMKVFKKLCPMSVIPGDYSNYMHMLFKMLHMYNTPTRTEYLTQEETTWLTKLLTECEEQVQPQSFRLNGDCGDNIEADGKGAKICTDPVFKFQPEKYDVLLDTIWRIYEVVNFQCFARFQGFSRIWHRYAMAIFDTYNLPMKQRWDAPVYSQALMEQLFGPSYKDYSENIDKCVHAYARRDKVIGERLPRIYQSYMSRYGQNIVNIFQNETEAIPDYTG